MSLARRHLIIGAGGALALCGAAGVYRATRMPVTAAAPWRIGPSPPEDVRLDAFRYAILAPNPHNRQPWRMTLSGRNEAIIHCDLDRRLPQTDPFDRQIVIGLGCFIEIAAIAASSRSVRVEVAAFPEGEPEPRLDHRPVARLHFVADSSLSPDPLFGHVLNRRSNKAPYDMSRTVPDAAMKRLAELSVEPILVAATQAPERAAQLRDLILRAFQLEIETPRTFQESVELLRFGSAQIDANPDGIPLKGPMFELLSLTGEAARRSAADPASTGFKRTMERYRATFAATPAFTWVTSADNSRRSQLSAGRSWLRLNLIATQLGLCVHPVSQTLQEFPEMAGLYREAREQLGAGEGQVVQMLARLGYGPAAEPTPRWPMETRLNTA